MREQKSVSELLKDVGFYSLTGMDGCLCAHITLRGIAIDVHCWRSEHHYTNYYGEKFSCGCRWAGIHITPLEPENEAELIAIGEVVRTEMERPDMNIQIFIHEPSNAFMYVGFEEPPKGERPKVTIIPASPPPEGFEYDASP